MQAIRFHPPSYDIRVEQVPIPRIQHPDDVIVKVKLAGLCGIRSVQGLNSSDKLLRVPGSDLHVYRGHAGVNVVHTCGHEFIGEVVELGSNYGAHAETTGRPGLYSTLKVGDKVVSPFTTNCGECHVCRLGFTCRCPFGALFGSPKLEGGQAQFVRVPYGAGTLYNLSDASSWTGSSLSETQKAELIETLADSSLLILSDILPTGVFAALQAMNHPKVHSIATRTPWPASLVDTNVSTVAEVALTDADKLLTFAIVGLGPVGICASVALLDILATRNLAYRIVAVDPLPSRREKMKKVYDRIGGDGKGTGEFVCLSIEEAKEKVKDWTSGIGCSAVLEVVGNNSALVLSYELVRPFGVITSVGVHGAPQIPYTGGQLYDKNVSLDFGRCPARAMFPLAFDLLAKRQDVFGTIGDDASLIHKVAGFSDAADLYSAFDKGEVGKILFDPWL